MSMSEYERAFNEKGRVCYSDGVVSQAALGIDYFLFDPNGIDVIITSIVFTGRAPDSRITLFENPTVTNPGTPIPSASYNRKLTKSPGATLANGTVTVSADGTELGHIVVFSPGGSATKSDVDSSSLTDNGVEYILDPSKQYLFKVENLDATVTSDFNFKIKWIEINN